MNKLLKVTLITAIMATSGMACGGDITRGSQSPIQNQCCEMMTKGALCAAAAYTAHKALCGECQHTTFDADSEYSQDYTISGNTWITRVADGDTAVITGNVKIKDRSRWIHNKGGIKLEGKDNIIDNSELINEGGIGVLGEEGNLDVTGNSSIYLRHGAYIEAYDGGILDVKDNSSIYLRGGAYIEAYDGGINVTDNSSISLRDGSYIDAEKGGINVTDNSSISLRDGAYIQAYEGGINVDKSTISMKDIAGIGANNNSTIKVDKSTISMKDSASIGANNSCTINVDNSSISLSDDAYIGAYDNSTININEGSIFDARDSKDLSKWNTFDGTFNMKAGSIMYLPSTDIDDDKKATDFTITLTSGDKPVELRYIQHTDITFDGLCPNVTHSGCKYTDPASVTSNTGIKFNGDTNRIRLTPIYTWSVSTKCDGEDVKILESRDLQCCDDILW